MSSVHHNPNWPVIKADLTFERVDLPFDRLDFSERNYPSFVARKLSSGMTYLWVLRVIQMTLKAVIEAARSEIKEPSFDHPSITLRGFHIDPTPTINQDVNALRERIQVLDLPPLGLSSSEHESSIRQAQAIVHAYFRHTGNPRFFYSDTQHTLEKWETKTAFALKTWGRRSLGIVQSAEPVKFSPEELSFFGIRGSPEVDPQTINCLAFALLKTRDLEAKEVIFNKKTADDTTRNLFPYLAAKNYRPVNAPDTGDLVVYLAHHVPQHIGYLTDDGRVHSKLGLANPYSHYHDLFNTNPNFGHRVIFFRKSHL